MNGNKKTSKIRGHDHFLHYFYRLIFPNATADEVRRWIFENSRYPKIYSRPDITKAEIDWHFSRKRCSTLANQAIAPANVARRNMFWSMPPPIGILNINRYTLLDLDECGLHLTSANRSEGKAKVNVRVACIGNYGHSDKLTIIAAVDASGFKDLYISDQPGTTSALFTEYIRRLLRRLAPGVRRIFLWDNLRAHYCPEVANLIYAAGHAIVPRTPYYPCDGPIEYVFNQLECGLRAHVFSIRCMGDLRRKTYQVFAGLSGFDATFRHCGY